MESKLAENIRTFRKERKLTQEQLAEVMGVTTGAVHKWEAGMSIPDLSLIMELADFYGVSVDVLIGYKIRDNRQDAIKKRLVGYCKTMDPEALTEVEKALKKYPNSLEMVLCSADIYLVFGTGEGGRDKLTRALELLDRALDLLPQNTNPKISTLSIYGRMANAYLLMGEYEKSADLMKKHNSACYFSDSIGVCMAAYLKQYKEAEDYLSEALIDHIGGIMNTISGFYLVFCSRKDYKSALDIISWGQEMLGKLAKNNDSGFLFKNKMLYLILIANVKLLTNRRQEAVDLITEARRLAGEFDTLPDYSLKSLRFADNLENAIVHDGLGRTAVESVDSLLKLVDNKELTDLWNKIYSQS